jgi:hypothetical protein
MKAKNMVTTNNEETNLISKDVEVMEQVTRNLLIKIRQNEANDKKKDLTEEIRQLLAKEKF